MLERLEVRPGKRTRLGRPAPAPAHVRLWLECLEARNMPGSSGLFGNLWQVPGVDLQPLVAAGDGPRLAPGQDREATAGVSPGLLADRSAPLDQTRIDPAGREGLPHLVGRDSNSNQVAKGVSEYGTSGMGLLVQLADESEGRSPPADSSSRPGDNSGSGHSDGILTATFLLSPPPCEDENSNAGSSEEEITSLCLVQGRAHNPASVDGDHVGLLTIDVSDFARDPNHVVRITQTRFVLKINGTEEYGYDINRATLTVDSDRHGTLRISLTDGPVGNPDLPHDALSVTITFSSDVIFTSHDTAPGTVRFGGLRQVESMASAEGSSLQNLSA